MFDHKQGQLRIDAAPTPIGGWRGAFGVQYDHPDISVVGEKALAPTHSDSTARLQPSDEVTTTSKEKPPTMSRSDSFHGFEAQMTYVVLTEPVVCL